MRSLRYDAAPALFNRLKNTNQAQDNLLQKSRQEDSLFENAPKVVDLYNERKIIGELIQKAFDDLTEDHRTNKINLARYKDNLKSFKDFFDTETDKYQIPDTLNVGAIKQEIDRYFPKTKGL